MSDDQRLNKQQGIRDPDILSSEAALRRAAQRARERARRSSGYVVIYRDGKIVEERVDDAAA